jgi:hypothetical protein
MPSVSISPSPLAPLSVTHSWSFKAAINATTVPTTPIDITVNGVFVTLATANGTVLDVVAYNGTDCKLKIVKNVPRRVDCRVKGQMGKLSLVYRLPSTAGKTYKPSNNATYTVIGSWRKRALHGATAASEVPLGVAVVVPNAAAFGEVCVHDSKC